jgi:hypothetical protein
VLHLHQNIKTSITISPTLISNWKNTIGNLLSKPNWNCKRG